MTSCDQRKSSSEENLPEVLWYSHCSSGTILASRRTHHPFWKSCPDLKEVVLLSSVASLLFVGTILYFRNYRSVVEGFGDSASYEAVVSAIRHWRFHGLQVKQFWGYPYVCAAFASLTGLSDLVSLLLISSTCCFISVFLAYRLWGGWVASFFAILNFDWMQRSLLGGAEPLAVALIFAAFAFVRKERYLPAVLLAALSTVVRPLGVLCLIAIGLNLIFKREYKKFAYAVMIGLLIGGLYCLPFALYFHDSLATVHSYVGERPLFGVPFYAIVEGTIRYQAPTTSLALSFCWIGTAVSAIVLMLCRPDFRAYAREFPVESLFAISYIIVILCYNYPVFARSNFSRFLIPALPIVFVAVAEWMPRDRRVIWALGVVMPVLAASSALGIRNVLRSFGGL